MKLALEKNKEEEKEKKDKEDEKTKATEKENEAKEKFRQEISDEVSKTVGAEVVKALKTIARAKMLRAMPIEEAKKTVFKPELRSSTGRVCLDSGSDQILRPLFKDEDESNLVGVRVELANGQIVGMQSNEKGSLICAPEVQAILPFVPLLENLKYKFLREDGEMILRRGEEKVKVHKDNNVFECDTAEGEKLMRELESLTEPLQGHDALVAAWKVVRQEKAKILAKMKGFSESS